MINNDVLYYNAKKIQKLLNHYYEISDKKKIIYIRWQYLVLQCQHIRDCVNDKRIIATLAVALLSVLKLLLENKNCIQKCQ